MSAATDWPSASKPMREQRHEHTEDNQRSACRMSWGSVSQDTPREHGRHVWWSAAPMATMPVQQAVDADRFKSCPPEALFRGHVTHSQFGFAWHTP